MKHVVIENSTPESTAILQVTDQERRICWAKLYKAEGHTIIHAQLDGELLPKLDILSLQYLYWNLFAEQPPGEFVELAPRILEAIEAMTDDVIPLAELQWRVELLEVDDGPTLVEQPPTGTPVPSSTGNESFELAAEIAAETPKPAAKIPGRPKEGSTTAAVWAAADKVLADQPQFEITSKDFRIQVVAKCEEAGINKSTAATQFGKWKKAQLSSN